MPAIHDTASPRLRSTYPTADLIRLYTPTADEIALADQVTKGLPARLGFLILLKTFQRLGYFLPFSSIPHSIVQHSAQATNLGAAIDQLAGYDASGTRRRHVQVIREYLQVQPYDHHARRVIIRAIASAAASKEDLADLINVGIAALVKLRYELPGFTSLEKIARRVRTAVYRMYYRQVVATLNDAARTRIDGWFVSDAETGRTLWQTMKQDPGSPTLTQLTELADRMAWLDAQPIDRGILAGIPDVKVKHVAAEAKTLDAVRMAAMQPDKRYTLAVALYAGEAARTRADLAEMLIKRMQSIHTHGKEALDAYRKTHTARTDALIGTLRDLVIAFGHDGSAEERLAALATALGDRSETILEGCAEHLAYAGNHYYPFLWKLLKSHRTVIMRILTLLTFRAASQDTRLEEAIAFLRAHVRSTGDYLTVAREQKVSPWQRAAVPLLDLSWIPDGWWRLVTETQSRRDTVWRVNRRHFTVCLFSQIVAALKNGDLYVVSSDRYADPRAQQITWEAYHAQVQDYGRLVELPIDGAAFVAHVRDWLENLAQQLDQAFLDNEHISFDGDRLVVRRLRARPLPAGARALQQIITERATPVNILDALTDTIRWFDWTRYFGPISGFDAKIADPATSYLITAFCYGCQLGPSQTARALVTVDRRHIAWVDQRHISIEMLDRAIELSIQHYERFVLPHLWGSPKRASADGTKWELYEHNLLSEQHIRYGGYGGIGYYHIAGTYIALFANLIACGAWEGNYIFDFFERYASITQPETLHADTQGQTEPIFGLAYLLNITLIPRIRNWQDRKRYRPSASSRYRHIDRLFDEVIDWDLIAKHLPDMLRVVLSIRAGTLTPSTLLRTLNSANQHNQVYRAFRELGRAIRTGVQLQCLASVELRQIVQEAQNKNEAFNRFAKWVGFGSGGVLTTNNREEQLKLIKYNHLISNCLICYTTSVITRLLHELVQEGYPVMPEAVAALSPYLTWYIDRFGRYEVNAQREPPPVVYDLSFELPPEALRVEAQTGWSRNGTTL
jgi:TnpA family transposase